MHLPICKELVVCQSRHHSSESVFHNEKSGIWVSFTLSLLPHTMIPSPAPQLTLIWSLKQKCILHTEYLRVLYPTWHIVTTDRSLFKGYSQFPPKQRLAPQISFDCFPTVFHIKANLKKKKKITQDLYFIICVF